MTVSRDYFHYTIGKINIIWAMLFPLLLAIILNIAQIQGLFILKDLVFYTSLILIIWSGRSFSYLMSLTKLALFVVFLLLITVLIFDLKPWIVYNLRQLLAPILIVFFGYYLKLSEDSSQLLISKFYRFSILLLVVGLIIKYFKLWPIINLTNYFNLKGIPVDANGLSYMFYEPAFGYTERLASTLLDPISLGHTFACAAILLFYGVFISGRKRWIYFILITAGLVLTFSKGALLQFVLAILFFNKNLSLRVRFLIPLMFVILTLFLINIDGILIHLLGLKNAVVYMNIFGHGLGLVGNYAKMFADDLTVYYTYEISDTFIGSVLGQIGLLGLIIWLSFFTKFTKQVLVPSRTYVGATIILSQLIVSVLSENTLNFNSFLISGLIGGVLVYNKI